MEGGLGRLLPVSTTTDETIGVVAIFQTYYAGPDVRPFLVDSLCHDELQKVYTFSLDVDGRPGLCQDHVAG